MKGTSESTLTPGPPCVWVVALPDDLELSVLPGLSLAYHLFHDPGCRQEEGRQTEGMRARNFKPR